MKASIAIEGAFEKWNAMLAFTSTDASTGLLDIKIQADSLNTGSKAVPGISKAETLIFTADRGTETFKRKLSSSGPRSTFVS